MGRFVAATNVALLKVSATIATDESLFLSRESAVAMAESIVSAFSFILEESIEEFRLLDFGTFATVFFVTVSTGGATLSESVCATAKATVKKQTNMRQNLFNERKSSLK